MHFEKKSFRYNPSKPSDPTFFPEGKMFELAIPNRKSKNRLYCGMRVAADPAEVRKAIVRVELVTGAGSVLAKFRMLEANYGVTPVLEEFPTFASPPYQSACLSAGEEAPRHASGALNIRNTGPRWNPLSAVMEMEALWVMQLCPLELPLALASEQDCKAVFWMEYIDIPFTYLEALVIGAVQTD